MAELETLIHSLLQLLKKYPIDNYRGAVSLSVMYKRYNIEKEFLKNETATINKLAIEAMEGFSITLDEVQQLINDVIKEHFRISWQFEPNNSNYLNLS